MREEKKLSIRKRKKDGTFRKGSPEPKDWNELKIARCNDPENKEKFIKRAKNWWATATPKQLKERRIKQIKTATGQKRSKKACLNISKGNSGKKRTFEMIRACARIAFKRDLENKQEKELKNFISNQKREKRAKLSKFYAKWTLISQIHKRTKEGLL